MGKIDKRKGRRVVQVYTLELREEDFYRACEIEWGVSGLSRSECFRRCADIFLQAHEIKEGNLESLEDVVRRIERINCK